MREICERFFYRKVNFFSLDVEGYGAQVLKGNNWSDPLCHPQLILSENNYMNVASKLENPKFILQ